ncbi:MAG: diiron oxygenase [Candidatus Saccharimonadales bacterium]
MRTHNPQPYESVLRAWDNQSAVRSKSRRVLDDVSEGHAFFSAKLTPIATHPIVVDRGAKVVHELLTRRLFQYLDFTAVLEQEIVNPVVLRLSRDAYGLTVPNRMKLDAYRIYCDEAYHALFSADIKHQIERYSNVRGASMRRPRFEVAISEAKSRLPSTLSGLVDLCAAFVSETLISGTLSALPADPTVAMVVRESMADHAADERTHHAYFVKVFDLYWNQLDRHVRQELGPCFADFIIAFLCPDLRAQQHLLRQMGFDGKEVAEIVSESYNDKQVTADVQRAARYTLGVLRRNNVLEMGATETRFAQLHLIP